MFRKFSIVAAAAVFALTAQTATAGSWMAGKSAALNDNHGTALIMVHSKRCKFIDENGNTYKDHCPHGFRKGDRKKRAGIGAAVGAGVGAVIGGIAGGGRGAAIGAASGAGAGALAGAASAKKKCRYKDEYGRTFIAKC
ncbi:MAG: hypothetical protein AAFW47_07450 [Pseudomonadota bacterium]